MALPHRAEKVVETFSKALHPKKTMQDTVGDLSGVEVMYNELLVAIYIRPERTAGGIIRPGDNVKEDCWQGKVGLVVKVGPNAFTYPEGVKGQKVEVGDWCAFKISDSWTLLINDVPCRLVQDRDIRLRLADPNMVL